jgi:hypothetical protein
MKAKKQPVRITADHEEGARLVFGAMKSKRTAEQIKRMVIKQITLRPELARWAFKRAKEEGHGDVSLIVRQGIDLLIARHKAGLPMA